MSLKSRDKIADQGICIIVKKSHKGQGPMKYFFYVIYLIALTSFSFSTQAQEFEHLKLKGLLKDRAQLLKSQHTGDSKSLSVQKRAINRREQLRLEQSDNQLRKTLFNTTTPRLRSMGQGQVNAAFFGGGQKDSLLYEYILESMGPSYQDEGHKQVGSILQYNHRFNLGETNFSGFTWQKPMGSISLYANRQVTPYFFGDNWIVQDELTINIDAVTFLNRLKEDDLIDIDQQQLRAFAGLSFQRTYEAYHFADTFEQGLGSDFSVLFLPFLRFSPQAVLEMDEGMILKRRDTMAVKAGAYLNTPSFYGLSARAGAIYEYDKKTQLTLQAMDQNDNTRPQEFLRLSLKEEKGNQAQVAASVSLDFFNLVRLTLLSYDLTYEYRSSKEYHLSFSHQDRPRLSPGGEHAQAFASLLSLNPKKIDELHDYHVSLEERMSENLQSNFNFLLMGRKRDNKTQQYRVSNEKEVTTFYRSNEGKLRYVQSPLSRLFGAVIQAVFDISTLVANQVEKYSHFSIEYRSESGNHDLEVKKQEDFSLEISEYLMANDTTGRLNRRYKEEAIEQLLMLTEVPNGIIKKVQQDTLKGPMKITTELRVLKKGLEFFHDIEDDAFYHLLSYSCGSRRIPKWSNPKTRKDLLRGYETVTRRFLWWKWKRKKRFKRTPEYRCTRGLGKTRDRYIKKLKRTGRYDLNEFKKFAKGLYQKTYGYDFMRAFFGNNNSFVHGSLHATGPKGRPFTYYYQNGNFQGFGVIDNYLQETNISRKPATVE